MNTLLALRVRVATGVASARHLATGDRGAAMAEYGLLLALIALVVIAMAAAFGGELLEVFTEAENQLNTRSTPVADS